MNRILQQETIADSFREATRIVGAPISALGDEDVLVRLHFAGINGLFDESLARGEVPYFELNLPMALGVEAVGVVERVGSRVTTFSAGDAVASSKLGAGYREWLIARPEDLIIVPAPTARYVALRTSAVSALIALENAGRMTSGETVVITAATGGLGQFLVQFAKRAGNTVIGVCGGPDKVALLRDLGCDRPVDRLSEDLGEVLDSEFNGSVQLAVDTVGGSLFDALVARLAPRGRLVTAGHASDIGVGMPVPVLAPRVYEHLYWRSSSIIGFQNSMYADDHLPALRRILDWDAAGELEVTVDPVRFRGLESIPDAVDHLTSGRSKGKVVVDLRP